ncbi:MAG: DUF2288 family protein, partial [Cyanobacteria bacterium P01_C01_bin.73]
MPRYNVKNLPLHTMPQDSMPPESSQTPPELVQDLNAMVEPVAWQWVMPHVQRDAVVVVNPNLDLVEVGAAIAADQVSLVQRWIGEALIAKPTADELSQW